MILLLQNLRITRKMICMMNSILCSGSFSIVQRDVNLRVFLRWCMCVVVFVISNRLVAQDLIVTHDGDTLNCRITKVKTDFIYFIFQHKGEIRNTLLPAGQVREYRFNYYANPVVGTAFVGQPDFPKIRAALNVGWSYRTAKMATDIPHGLKSYMDDLRSGYHFGLDASWFFSEMFGGGLKFTTYRTTSTLENVSVTQSNGQTAYGKMSDDMTINFIGPVFNSRLLSDSKKNSLLMNIGVGYIGYKDNAVLLSAYQLKSSTLGVCWEVGYDLGISKHLALGIQLSYLMGTLTRVKMYQAGSVTTIKFDEKDYEDLSRIDFSVGLRFNK